MGFSSIVGALVFLFIFAGMAAFAIQATKHITAAQQQEGKAAALDRKQAGMQLTLTDLDYSYGTLVPWIDDAYGDFQGNVTNTAVVSPGTITLVGPVYSLDGTYVSQAIDTGATSNYTTLSWTSVEPALTAISFQLRSAATAAGLPAATFTGPDGTPGTYYVVSGSAVHASVSGQRFVQYQALLDTNDTGATPQLQAVRLGVVRNTGILTLNATNTGVEKLILNQTDIYVGGVRIPRNVSRRTFDRTGMTDQILWEPGQRLGITVFGALVPPQPVSIANGDARAAGTVS